MTLADAVDAAASHAELRAKLLLLLAEWHQEAEDWRSDNGPSDDATPDYASGILSAWDDLREVLGVAV